MIVFVKEVTGRAVREETGPEEMEGEQENTVAGTSGSALRSYFKLRFSLTISARETRYPS